MGFFLSFICILKGFTINKCEKKFFGDFWLPKEAKSGLHILSGSGDDI